MIFKPECTYGLTVTQFNTGKIQNILVSKSSGVENEIFCNATRVCNDSIKIALHAVENLPECEILLKTKVVIKMGDGSSSIDGPSAGLAVACALISFALNRKQEVASTGTIDIMGNVGKIGLLPEKALIASRYGLKLFLSRENEKDFDQLDENVISDISELLPPWDDS